tara:strand:+ start:208 stop:930 length:723 start_codon:yes stop_codon:yes gene_type:complete
MDITRVYLEKEFLFEEELQITEEAGRHLFKVLRKKTGDEVELFDGRGSSCVASLIEPKKNEYRVMVISENYFSARKGIEIDIGLSLIKNDPFSLALQKSAELGVKSVTPLITERTQVNLNTISKNKKTRWNSIVRGACEQCGDNWVPEISGLMDLFSWAEKINSETKLVLYPGSEKRITEIPISDSIALAVGPVGDFSEKEIKQLEKVDFIPVSIGERILRAETAVISSLSCLRTMAGEF